MFYLVHILHTDIAFDVLLFSLQTRILVTHHVTGLEDADLIIVLHEGRIVEAGTYHGLLHHQGAFSDLISQQFDEDDDRDGGDGLKELRGIVLTLT